MRMPCIRLSTHTGEVPFTEHAKGYRYGGQIVHYGEADEESLRLQTGACLKFLGFVPAAELKRHQFMERAGIVAADPAAPNSQPARPSNSETTAFKRSLRADPGAVVAPSAKPLR